MHILVTGGAGFIGSHVVEYHLARKDIVHVIDDLSTGSLENLAAFQGNPNFHFTQDDLLTYPHIEKIVSWADRVYHFAAIVGAFRVLEEPERVLSVNMGATERLFRAARASIWAPRIMVASTSEVYGNDLEGAVSENADIVIPNQFKSRVTYPISKIAAEAFSNSYVQRFNIPATVLRFFNTIGPKQTGKYGMVVPRFVKMAVHNQPITVFGTGEQVRSFVDVRDMTSYILELADNDKTVGQTINVGNNVPISMNQLAERIKFLAQSASEIVHIPYEKAYDEEFDDCMYREPNLTLLHRFTNYRPQWDLDGTLRDLINIERAKED